MKIHAHKKTCIGMFLAALFIKAKNQEQHKYVHQEPGLFM